MFDTNQIARANFISKKYPTLLDDNKSPSNQRLDTVLRRILKVLVITVLSVGVLVCSVIITWNVMITPPEQLELIAAPPAEEHTPRVDDEGFYILRLSDHNAYDEHEQYEEYIEYKADEAYAYDKYEECPWPTYNAPYWATDRREYFWTFLIIGLNQGTNANTVMVASYCGITREANLISIPRDVPVNATRNGRRISSSYMIGARTGGIAGGVAQMQRDVQTIIGFVPDYYIVINYDAFFKIIDALGGIEVYVPIRMRYDDPFQNLRIDIQPGFQRMDSETALHFSRFRQSNRGSRYPGLPDGDIGRTRNQQAVIGAVINELLRVENLNPIRINEFMGIFNESVYTNISFLTDMPFFANELRHINGTDALNTDTFPTHSGMVNGVSYQWLTPSTVVEILNNTINPFDRDISPSDLRILRP